MLKELLKDLKVKDTLKELIGQLEYIEEYLIEKNISYEDVIDELINDKNVSIIIEGILSKCNYNKINNGFIVYLINNYKIKSKENDSELIELLTNKTPLNEEKIIKKFDKLVMKYASKYKYFGIEFEDLVQVGRLGLLKAIKLYDINRNAKFITFAVWYVRGAMQREIRNSARTIRIPSHMIDDIYKLSKARSDFTAINGRKPTNDELCDILGISEDRLNKLISYSKSIDSLDREIDDGSSKDNTLLSNFIPDTNPGPEEVSEKKLLIQDVEKLLSDVNLTDIQTCVIKYRFGLGGIEPMTLEQIANIYGVTRERIRQVEETALRRLKNSPYSKELEVYINGNISPLLLPKRIKWVNNLQDIDKVKKEGTEMRIAKRFYDMFSDYSESEVQAAVDKLPYEYKEIVFARYGKNLDEINDNWTATQRSKFYRGIKDLINTFLVNPNYKYDSSKKRCTKEKSLFERVSGYGEEIVKKAVETLTPEQKEIVVHKFGTDLKAVFYVTDEERIKLNTSIIPILKKRCKQISRGQEIKQTRQKKMDKVSLASVDAGTIDILGTPRDDIKTEAINVSVDDINNIDKQEEENISNGRVKITSEKRDTAHSNIEDSDSIQSMVQNEDSVQMAVRNCRHLESIVSNPDFKEFVRTLNIIDITIASLAFGYINDYYDIDSIAGFLNMKRETIEKGIKEILVLYKKRINEQLDDAISSPIQKHLAL